MPACHDLLLTHGSRLLRNSGREIDAKNMKFWLRIYVTASVTIGAGEAGSPVLEAAGRQIVIGRGEVPALHGMVMRPAKKWATSEEAALEAG